MRPAGDGDGDGGWIVSEPEEWPCPRISLYAYYYHSRSQVSLHERMSESECVLPSSSSQSVAFTHWITLVHLEESRIPNITRTES